MFFIKNSILKLSFLLIICSTKIVAQFPNPLNFNTATNASNTGTLAMLSNDLHWTAALTNSLGPYVPAVVCGNQAPCCWVNSTFPNSNWITYPHTCSASPAEHNCLGNVDEFYKATLVLPSLACGQSVVTPSAYCLSLDFYADNWVSEIYVNNVLSFINPHPNPYLGGFGFSPGNNFTASMCNNWQVGTNTIIVHVKSGAPTFPGHTGFLAQANQTVNLSVGVPLNATISQTNVSCSGNNNGAASVNANGGGGSSYTYTWLPTGGNANTANNLTAGNYSVIVASVSGCTSIQTFTLTQPAASLLTVSNNTSVCLGNTVTISASGANSYLWSNGATGAVITVNSAGIYTVTGSNSAGCSQTNTVGIALAPSPTIAIAGNSIVCPGSITTLSASGANSYTWSTGVTNSVLNISPNTNSIYTVTANTNNSSCISTQTYSVNVQPLPNLSISGTTALCNGSTGIITVSGADTYIWNAGQTSNSLSIATTTTNYSVIGTNTTTGCSSNTNVNITVGNYPIITINSNTVCQGQASAITASGALSYTWSEGTIDSVLNLIPLTSQIYTVTGAGTLLFCTSTQTVLITVLPSPTLSLTTDKTQICLGYSANLNASGTTSYLWNNGETTNNITVSPTLTSTYTVTGSNTNSLCKTTQTISIIVNKQPNVKIISDSLTCVGDVTILKAIGASNYLWNNGLNTQTISVILTEDDVYTLVGVDIVSGCNNTYSTNLKASDACCELYIPNTFTPNDDSKNDYFYPLSLCKFKDYKLTIYNRWGEKIFIANTINEPWNGFYKSELCKQDVYVYTLDYTIIKNSGIGSKRFYKTGHINLIKGD